MATSAGNNGQFPSLSSQLIMPQVGMAPANGDVQLPVAPVPPKVSEDGSFTEKKIRSPLDITIDDDVQNFDWKWLCMPRLPWAKELTPPPFYGIHAKLPIPVALVMGFQHALAMMGGIITPPILVSGIFYARFTNEETQYLLAVGLICSGILSFTQIYQLKIYKGWVLGTGFISVVGTSFVFLPIAQSSIVFMMNMDSPNHCNTDADCTRAWAGQFGAYAGVAIPGVTNSKQCNTVTNRCKYRYAPQHFLVPIESLRCARGMKQDSLRIAPFPKIDRGPGCRLICSTGSGQEGYGAFIGTCMVCAFLQVGLSFVPKQ